MNRTSTRRIGTLGVALLLCMFAVGARLAFVQGVRSEAYTQEARKQRVRKIELPARRGAIYDRHGGELAVSIPARTIYANPKLIKNVPQAARALAPLLQKGEGEVEALLRKDTGFVYLARRVGIVTAKNVTELKLPGVGMVDEPRRLYPGGSLAANIVGFIGTDQKGLAGLEYSYQELLGGSAGFRVLEQDPQGRRIPHGEFAEVPPVPGSDIQLTIDPDLQLAADKALAKAVDITHAKGGMIVALDPRSGEILAMSSNPSYDPNALGKIDATSTKNRAVTDAYEPGSINKVITAAAALAEGAIKPDEQMFIPHTLRIADKTFLEERAGGMSLDIRGILSKSSNLGTIRVAQRVGADKLDTYFAKFGYGRGTGLGFPGESKGLLPSASRYATSLPTMAIGQGLSVTPLQIAQVYTTIANDGVAIEPRLVSGWVGPDGKMQQAAAPRRHRVIPASIAQQVRDMLKTVVAEGTGVRGQIPGFDVAGKTGTARKLVEGVGYQGHMASFVGMFPAEAPEVVIAVVLDDSFPIEGGLAAAPVFSEVGNQAARILRVQPTG